MKINIKILTLLSSLLCSAMAGANPIDASKALDIASRYLVPGNAMQLVSKAKRTPERAKFLPKNIADTAPYYIISRGFDKGFVIVSGDDCLPEILGYTDSGNFDEENMPPALREWLNYRAEIIERAQAEGANTPRSEGAESRLKRASGRTQDVPELIQTLWHQSSPYNDKCPTLTSNGNRAATGCVATAAAQIIYYWHREANTKLSYDTPTYSYGDAPCREEFKLLRGTPIKYDLMRPSYSSEPEQFRDAVATLMAAVGMSAWLTYGSSTSGQIGDCVNVFGNQFGLNGGKCVYKSNGYSEEAWANLLYEELINSRPVLYTGCDAENSGHAVVCDGYQASSGFFHINFGWGPNYNGYFSLVDGVKGWGFNASSQGCVYGICPKRPNLDVTVKLPTHVYKNTDNSFTLNVINNGTLPFSGFYLFANEKSGKPSSLTAAKAKDLETIVEVDATKKVTLTARPTTNNTLYLYVTDKDLNVLAQTTVDVETADAELSVSSICPLTTTEDSLVNGIHFGKVYNNNAYINVEVHNGGQTAWAGTSRLAVYESADNGATWTFTKNITKRDEVPAMGSTTMSFLATSLSAQKLYKACLNQEWGTTTTPDSVRFTSEATDTVAYFCSMGATDMQAAYADNCLTLSGHWDVYRYNYYCTLAKYKDATCIDITGCKGVGEMPSVAYPNPNVLIYAPDQVYGKNVIDASGICQEVSLTAGYDFKPKGEFNAWAGRLYLNQEPNRWYLLCPPFECDVPDGVIAREVTTKHSSTSMAIYNKTTNIRRLEAGKVYLVMTSSDTKYLEYCSGAKSFCVLDKPSDNVVDPAFVGTFVSTAVPKGAKLINGYGSTEAQKFVLAEDGASAEGLRGYFFDSVMNTAKTDFSAASKSVTDPSYLILGQTIQTMYDIYNEFRDVVSNDANEIMLDSLRNAEKLFTEQPYNSSEVKTYYTGLQQFMEQYKTMIGDAGNSEIDMTALITNPSFEASATNAVGWTVEGSEWSLPLGTKPNTYYAVGIDGERIFYSRGNAAAGVSVQQTIEGLKPGYYRLTAMIGTDPQCSVTVFAGDSTVTADAHPFGDLYLNKVTLNNVLVTCDAGSDTGSLCIGVRSADWFKADAFTLTYVGGIKDKEAVGISVPTVAGKHSDAIFNLQGIRISRPAPGSIYIKGGKVFRMP